MLIKDFTEKDWVDSGFMKYEDHWNYANCLYQKCVYGELGRKAYYINIYFYEETVHPHTKEPINKSYMAEVAFQNSKPYTIIQLNQINDFNLHEIESLFATHWEILRYPYYSTEKEDFDCLNNFCQSPYLIYLTINI